ncbi:MAG TPA: tRNA (adenosine(37)-N6)-threonylcarbamoyltransferase complex transferase subunit TsaD [Bacteroidia bacterium]|nr:tRNA (adenosine(37)-N6)-threonylcarbamoyltransferase complex transferase subunit TsaD [Bacteroidia bacterium]
MKIINTRILAIESSCDDTSCAVLLNERVLSNVTAGQDVHKLYGGVVPELASRDHQKNILPVVHAALEQACVSLAELDAVAVTRGPGLMGSLLVGLSFAKSLSLALNKPLIEVNHMQAHVLAHFIESDKQKSPGFPFLCLTVSGGHTQLVLVKARLEFEVLGQSIDDAVGEAFDKAAKILGLPYPGGPVIDQLASKGSPTRFSFAHPKTEGYNFSFSGIKTSFLYFIQNETQKDLNFVSKNIHDICASYQHHLVQVLLKQVRRVMKDKALKHLALAGGVSANSELRKQIQQLGVELGTEVYLPEFQYCTDNAAMIGIAAYFKFQRSEFADLSLTPLARMPL